MGVGWWRWGGDGVEMRWWWWGGIGERHREKKESKDLFPCCLDMTTTVFCGIPPRCLNFAGGEIQFSDVQHDCSTVIPNSTCDLISHRMNGNRVLEF